VRVRAHATLKSRGRIEPWSQSRELPTYRSVRGHFRVPNWQSRHAPVVIPKAGAGSGGVRYSGDKTDSTRCRTCRMESSKRTRDLPGASATRTQTAFPRPSTLPNPLPGGTGGRKQMARRHAWGGLLKAAYPRRIGRRAQRDGDRFALSPSGLSPLSPACSSASRGRKRRDCPRGPRLFERAGRGSCRDTHVTSVLYVRSSARSWRPGHRGMLIRSYYPL
jgi:hypothetical protein